MVRNLMLVAALFGSMVFAGGEAQAFGKKGCGGKLFGGSGQVVNSGCSGQVVSSSGCGSSPTYGTTTFSTPYTTSYPATTTFSTPYTQSYSTPYITPTTYSTPYISPTTSTYSTPYTAPSTVVSSPSITSQTAIIDGKNYTLIQTGTMSNGQPVYSISPTAVTTPSTQLPMPTPKK